MMRGGRGQIAIEYLLILAGVVVVTLIGTSTFHTDIATIFQRLFTSAVEHLPLDDGGPPPPEPPPSEPPPPEPPPPEP